MQRELNRDFVLTANLSCLGFSPIGHFRGQLEDDWNAPATNDDNMRMIPELIAEKVYKSFGGRRVLCGINLEINRGELVAIVGGSGSGKTVLLRHFVGHFQPDSGRILVADHETANAPLVDLATLSDEALDRLRRHWAVVFQGNALFPGTVYDNIALALREVRVGRRR